VDGETAVNSTGSFGKIWKEGQAKATQTLDARTTMASYSNYRGTVVRYLRTRWVQKGAVLWEEGDLSDDCFYFVVAGELDVMVTRNKDTGGRPESVNMLGSGETFGDVAVLADFNATGGKRTAGITASSDACLICLKRVDYLHVTGEYVELAVRSLKQNPDLRNSMEMNMLKDLFEGCAVYGSSHTSTFSDRWAVFCCILSRSLNQKMCGLPPLISALSIRIPGNEAAK